MRKLYRSSRDRKLFGICGGLADFLSVDVTLLRILLIIVSFFSGGSVILVYLIAGFVIPSDTRFTNGGYGGASHYGGGSTSNGWSHSDSSHVPPPFVGQFSSSQSTQGTAWQGARPAASSTPNAGAISSAHGLDAMMEDIEKKALRRELEELKARVKQFEKDSKGEK